MPRQVTLIDRRLDPDRRQVGDDERRVCGFLSEDVADGDMPLRHDAARRGSAKEHAPGGKECSKPLQIDLAPRG
jgi:hypothetical protein